MTAQISERLLVNGEKVALLSEPLNEYFNLGGHNPGFQSTSTALWRGYVGTWEILADRLYLVGLEGVLESGEEASIESIFPGYPERVFAHWFSGSLRIPKGKLLNYVHMGYSSTYEKDLFMQIRRGVLIGQHTQNNGRAEPDAPDGYRVNAMTLWPSNHQGECK